MTHRKLARLGILTSFLFLTGFSTTSAGDQIPKTPAGPDYILVTREQMMQLNEEVQKIIKANVVLEMQLETARDTIKYGMGCT